MNFFQHGMHNRSPAVSDMCRMHQGFLPSARRSSDHRHIPVGRRVRLALLDQGRDVIRGLVDSANAVISNWPPKGETLREVLPIIWRWVAFMLACAWSGINAWYWANLLDKTGDKGRSAAAALVSSSGAEASACCHCWPAFVAMPSSARHGISDTWLGMLCFAAAAGLLLWFFAYRTTWFTEEKAPKTYKEVDREQNLVQGDTGSSVRRSRYPSLILLIAADSRSWRTEVCLDRRARPRLHTALSAASFRSPAA